MNISYIYSYKASNRVQLGREANEARANILQGYYVREGRGYVEKQEAVFQGEEIHNMDYILKLRTYTLLADSRKY